MGMQRFMSDQKCLLSILNTLHLLSEICNFFVIPTQTLIHFQVVLNLTTYVIHFL